jgi:hypothetical protein
MEETVDPQGRFRSLVVAIMTIGCAVSMASATLLTLSTAA